MLEDIDKITDEILKDIIKEEKEEEIKRQEIIKNGCPHANKTERVGMFSGIHFLECDVCFKQFDMKGNEIQG